MKMREKGIFYHFKFLHLISIIRAEFLNLFRSSNPESNKKCSDFKFYSQISVFVFFDALFKF